MGLFDAPATSSIAGIFDAKVQRNDLKPDPESVVVPTEGSDSKTDAQESENEEEDDASASKTSTKKAEKPKLDPKTKEKQTVFIGNLNSKVITDKDAFKEFKKFVRQKGPVISIRFRSIAFSELLPRKAAYILQKLHTARDAVNAYVVYEQESSVEEALKLNGEIFLEHHLRVDSASNPAPQNRKRSVFLGNMDFEAKEEELYRHFEKCGEIEYVRIVRDSKTNVGKGFGYVQFKETSAVPLAILLNGTEFSGRPLRVTHCKAAGDKKLVNSSAFADQKRKNNKTKKRKQSDEVIEGERAKPEDGASLGRKRKPRHRNDPSKKKQKK